MNKYFCPKCGNAIRRKETYVYTIGVYPDGGKATARRCRKCGFEVEDIDRILEILWKNFAHKGEEE